MKCIDIDNTFISDEGIRYLANSNYVSSLTQLLVDETPLISSKGLSDLIINNNNYDNNNNIINKNNNNYNNDDDDNDMVVIVIAQYFSYCNFRCFY